MSSDAIKLVWGSRVKILLCDFHRKQAWQRWVTNKDNGVPAAQKKFVLRKLDDIAMAEDEETFNKLVHAFTTETELSALQHLQQYFKTEWLSCKDMWARHDRVLYYGGVNTNNMTESLNNKIKKHYFSRAFNRRVETILRMFEEEIMPDFVDAYEEAQRRAADTTIVWQDPPPPELCTVHRPLPVLQALIKRRAEGHRIAQDRPYLVVGSIMRMHKNDKALREVLMAKTKAGDLEPSTTLEALTASGVTMLDPAWTYEVDMQQGSCTCLDWIRVRMPCKHMFAALSLLGIPFNHLPPCVINTPHLVVDTTNMMMSVPAHTLHRTMDEDLPCSAEGADEDCPDMDAEDAEICALLEGLDQAPQEVCPLRTGSTNKLMGEVHSSFKHLQSLAYGASADVLQVIRRLQTEMEAQLLAGRPRIHDKRPHPSAEDIGVQEFTTKKRRGRPKGPTRSALADYNRAR